MFRGRFRGRYVVSRGGLFTCLVFEATDGFSWDACRPRKLSS